jgi:GAF domain-containing protein
MISGKKDKATLEEVILKLEQRDAELAVINSVQASLAAKMDMNGIYELVGEKIREIFNAQVIDIVTYNKDSNTIEDLYSFENGDRSLLGPREPKGFRKHVIETGKLLVINRDAEILSLQYDNTILIGQQTKSAVFVPLISGGNMSGVISLQNLDQENAFSDSDVNLLTTLANSMSVALENARLFDQTNRLLKETEQRTAELSVINSVQDGLAKELDIQGIYELVGEKMREIFNAQVIDIVTYNKATNLIEDCYAYEKGDRSLLGPREPKGFRKHIIDTGKLLVINRDADILSLQYEQPTLIGEQPQSAVFVPLISGGNINGIISLQNLDQENAYSDADVNLLTTLANSMSVALQNARLFDQTNRLLKETEQRTAELSVINSVQDGLAKELDIQGVYELVGEKMREIFNAQVIDIVTYNKTTNLIEDCYAYEKGDRSLLGPREPKGFRKHVIDTGKLLVINRDMDILQLQYDNTTLIGEQTLSALFVPLISGGKVNGVISLQNLDQENAFSDADVNLLTTLSNSMSVALQNARLFDETNRLLKETEQRTAELSVINSVQEGLAKELDIQGVYELVGEKMREIFKAQVIDIVTYNKTTNLIQDCYAYEKGDRSLLGPREPKGFRKHILESGKLLVINRDVEILSLQYEHTVIIGELPKSAVFVPLISGGNINGIISLQNLDQENAFSDSDVNLLTTLANSMSVALENARLFAETTRLLKETEQRTAELSVINSVQEGLAKELDIHGIYELVGEKMRAIFKAQVIDIVTYNKTTNLIQDCYAYEKGDRSLLGPREPKGFRKHILDSGKLLVINHNFDIISLQYDDNKTLIGELPKSVVFVPMISGGNVNGVISLQNLDEENAFSESEVSLLTTLSNSMSVALENARLFDETNRLLKETEQRTAELSVINSVQEGLAKELDIQSIYELVGEKMREIFKAQVIDIVTYDKTNNLITDCFAYEKGDTTLIGPREPKGFRKHVIETAKTLVINKDVELLSSKYDNQVIVGEIAKSLVLVPMIAGDLVTGVISLQNLDKENAFSNSDVSLLKTISNSMSVALQNARLFDETNRLLKETEQRQAELAVINSVQDGLAKEPDIQGIYELVGDKMREIFKVQVIDIVSYDKKNNLIEDCFAYEKGDTTLLGPREPKGFRKHIINTGQLLVINSDYDALSLEYDNTTMIGEQPKSAVFVPLISGEEVTGVISLQNIDQENSFSDSDVNLLTTFANSMSVALENARLFDETNRLLKETEQRTTELSAINSVQEGLAKELDIQGIYGFVGEKMREIFKAQVIDIVTFNKETHLIEDCYAYEKGDTTLLGPREAKGFRKHVIETAKNLVINTDVSLQRSKYDNTILLGEGAKSIVFVPMIAGEEVTGVVSLQNLDYENAFSDSDVNLLTTFVNSMSVALENARLFNETTRLLGETEQRATEMITVNNISRALVSQLEFNALIKMIGEQMQLTFKADIVYLALHDRKTDMIHFPYVYGDTLESCPFGNGMTEKIILSMEPMLINHNIEEAFDLLNAERRGKVVESFLGVPIIVGTNAIGIISVQSTNEERNFNENDQRLLTTIAANVGIAMHNADAYQKLQAALTDLKSAQEQLVQQEKLASLGQLAAGIAHEIKNPLNFVNNFSEVNTELIDEMKQEIDKGNMDEAKAIATDIKENQEKITHHGKRADAIVKSMLQHSRSSTGVKEPTDLNALSDEYLRLAYHGLRAKDKSFNATMKTDFDATLGKINVIPQDIGRVILNLITNAFYAVDEKKKKLGDGYEPTVSVSTKKINGMVEVSVRDNGKGIPKKLINKIFQPFFTTKPTGQGTGLGLSLSYDIIKAHGGELNVETKEGEGTRFIIILPE